MNDTYIYSIPFMNRVRNIEISKICPIEIINLQIKIDYLPLKHDKHTRWPRGKVSHQPIIEDIQLHTCVDPWKKADDRIPIDIKYITSVLNKITIENYDKMLAETLTFNYSNPDVVMKLFKKVLGEPFFSGIYAKLCKDLVDLHPLIKELCIQEFTAKKHKNLAVFIGELYKVGLVDNLSSFIDVLMEDLNDLNLEILCTLMKTIGINSECFAQIMKYLRTVLNTYKPRFRFMIMDILENINVCK
jgi:hypothetical protein